MALLGLLMLQSAVDLSAPRQFDLHPFTAEPPCGAGSESEIVVCADPDRGGRYRLPPGLPDGSDTAPGALTDFGLLGPAHGGVRLEQRSVGGIPSNAVMFDLKLPF